MVKELTLRVAAAAVRALAALAGLFAGRRRDGIVLISCQGDEPSQDIKDLAAALHADHGDGSSDHGDGSSDHGDGSSDHGDGSSYHGDGASVRVIAGKIRRSFVGAFLFIGKLYSMLRLIAGARVVVVDAYCVAVSIPKKRPGQTVIQLWHAPEAIKKFSWQIVDTPAGYKKKTAEILCMHRNYDHILCPAEATRPFFSESFGYPEDAFVKLGLPSLDRLGLMKRPEPGEAESPERAAKRCAIYERYPALSAPQIQTESNSDRAIREEGKKRPLTVVYAPTFRDGAPVDVSALIRAFDQTGETALVLKLHPLDTQALGGLPSTGWIASSRTPAEDMASRNDREDTEFADDSRMPRPEDMALRNDGEDIGVPAPCPIIEDKEFPLVDWYAAADIIITDYSGVAVEAAAAGIASYYYIYDIDEYMARRGQNVDLREEAIGKYAFTDAEALAARMAIDFEDVDCFAASAVAAPRNDKNCAYDYEALASFAGKYLEVPLSGNIEKLAAFIIASKS